MFNCPQSVCRQESTTTLLSTLAPAGLLTALECSIRQQSFPVDYVSLQNFFILFSVFAVWPGGCQCIFLARRSLGQVDVGGQLPAISRSRLGSGCHPRLFTGQLSRQRWTTGHRTKSGHRNPSDIGTIGRTSELWHRTADRVGESEFDGPHNFGNYEWAQLTMKRLSQKISLCHARVSCQSRPEFSCQTVRRSGFVESWVDF